MKRKKSKVSKGVDFSVKGEFAPIEEFAANAASDSGRFDSRSLPNAEVVIDAFAIAKSLDDAIVEQSDSDVPPKAQPIAFSGAESEELGNGQIVEQRLVAEHSEVSAEKSQEHVSNIDVTTTLAVAFTVEDEMRLVETEPEQWWTAQSSSPIEIGVADVELPYSDPVLGEGSPQFANEALELVQTDATSSLNSVEVIDENEAEVAAYFKVEGSITLDKKTTEAGSVDLPDGSTEISRDAVELELSANADKDAADRHIVIHRQQNFLKPSVYAESEESSSIRESRTNPESASILEVATAPYTVTFVDVAPNSDLTNSSFEQESILVSTEQIAAEPTGTEPTEPEPTEPALTEPAPTEQASTEPAPTEASPTEPESTEPEPTEPEPTEPAPIEPAPTEAALTEPAPTEAALTEPAPTEPTPTEPTPTEPTPTEPTPTEPTPTEPAPTEAEPRGPVAKENLSTDNSHTQKAKVFVSSPEVTTPDPSHRFGGIDLSDENIQDLREKSDGCYGVVFGFSGIGKSSCLEIISKSLNHEVKIDRISTRSGLMSVIQIPIHKKNQDIYLVDVAGEDVLSWLVHVAKCDVDDIRNHFKIHDAHDFADAMSVNSSNANFSKLIDGARAIYVIIPARSEPGTVTSISVRECVSMMKNYIVGKELTVLVNHTDNIDVVLTENENRHYCKISSGEDFLMANANYSNFLQMRALPEYDFNKLMALENAYIRLAHGNSADVTQRKEYFVNNTKFSLNRIFTEVAKNSDFTYQFIYLFYPVRRLLARRNREIENNN